MQYIDQPGKYQCKVVKPDNWFGESTEKKTPYLRIPVVVNEPGSSQHGRYGTYMAWLSDKAVEGTCKRLAEVFPGWDGDMGPLARGEDCFDGMPCSITCEAEEFEGKTRVKVQWLNAPGGGSAPLSQDKLNALLASIGEKAKAAAAGSDPY